MSGKILTLWVFTFLYGTSLGQTHLERKKGFQFNVQSFAMMVTDKDENLSDSQPEELYMHPRESYLLGINFEAHYRFDEYLVVGLGTGFEQIHHPDISYVPVYISLRSSIGGEKIEAPIFRLDIGTHFGDLAKNGTLLRVGMGYRLPIFKALCANFEGLLTYQAIRKEFDIQPDVVQYYNMVGIGIGVGLEL
ncbi:MAG TPA: hypothetical protein VL022_08010 [Moheibacter sp.]|nr:hypothetical protein [Moheibacter sp.]